MSSWTSANPPAIIAGVSFPCIGRVPVCTVFSPQGELLKVIGFETAESFCLNNGKIFYIAGTMLFRPTTATIKELSTNHNSLAQWEAYGPLKN